jgi:hypothetical protein
MIETSVVLRIVRQCLNTQTKDLELEDKFEAAPGITVCKLSRGSSNASLILIAFNEIKATIISISIENTSKSLLDGEDLVKLFCLKVKAQLK